MQLEVRHGDGRRTQTGRDVVLMFPPTDLPGCVEVRDFVSPLWTWLRVGCASTAAARKLESYGFKG